MRGVLYFTFSIFFRYQVIVDQADLLFIFICFDKLLIYELVWLENGSDNIEYFIPLLFNLSVNLSVLLEFCSMLTCFTTGYIISRIQFTFIALIN